MRAGRASAFTVDPPLELPLDSRKSGFVTFEATANTPMKDKVKR
jgi:hypothetical protein